jgi:torulene dioxygenase
LGKFVPVFTPIEPPRPDSASIPVCIRSIPRRGAEKSEIALILESDFSITKELDHEALGPIGIANKSPLHHLFKGPISCAHSMTDRDTGDGFNYNLDFGRYATYRVFRVNTGSRIIDILATITGPNTSQHISIHFFSLRIFVILCTWTSNVAAGGMRVLWEKNVLGAICPFDPTQKVRWLVVDRKRGRGLVAEFESPAAFCFHTVNAWQQPNPSGSEDIMCDLLEYPNLDITHKFYYSNLVSSAQDSAPFQRKREHLPPTPRKIRTAEHPTAQSHRKQCYPSPSSSSRTPNDNA